MTYTYTYTYTCANENAGGDPLLDQHRLGPAGAVLSGLGRHVQGVAVSFVSRVGRLVVRPLQGAGSGRWLAGRVWPNAFGGTSVTDRGASRMHT